MTRKQIDYLIQVHEGHRDHALRNLREVLKKEAQGQEVRWTRLYLVHKAMIEALNEENPMMNNTGGESPHNAMMSWYKKKLMLMKN